MKHTVFGKTAVALVLFSAGALALAQNPPLYGPRRSPSPAGTTSATATRETSTTQTREKGKLSSADKSFIKDAAKGGMMEVAMGRQAEQNATDAEVKKFGARMVTDHSKANSELKSLANEEGVALPGEKEPPKWKSDKDYMSMMVKDHEKDLAEFEKEAKEGSDPDLKAFAERTSKTIRKHLQMAREIDGKLK